jgi:hypothetical protein
MFWIGMIVGIVFVIAVSFGYFMWCMHVTGTSWDEFLELVEANTTTLENRESTIRVIHEGECLFEATFEEK